MPGAAPLTMLKTTEKTNSTPATTMRKMLWERSIRTAVDSWSLRPFCSFLVSSYRTMSSLADSLPMRCQSSPTSSCSSAYLVLAISFLNASNVSRRRGLSSAGASWMACSAHSSTSPRSGWCRFAVFLNSFDFARAMPHHARHSSARSWARALKERYASSLRFSAPSWASALLRRDSTERASSTCRCSTCSTVLMVVWLVTL